MRTLLDWLQVEQRNKLISIGYDVQIFILNSATMGVPQSRERVFFIARRRDLGLLPIRLDFNERPIPFGHIADKGSKSAKPKELWSSIKARWSYVKEGDQNLKFADALYRGLKSPTAFFGTNIVYDDVVPNTLTSSGTTIYYNEVRNLNDTEYRKMSSFPYDYDFCGANVRYVCGMSVPPLMIAKIATEIKRQWFKKS